MPKIHGATPPLFRKVRDRYGEDSKIAKFVEVYKVEKGKALLAVTWEEIETKKMPSVKNVLRANYMVVASHTYDFGHFVLLPSQVPYVDVCRMDGEDDREKVHFVIVDERHIYASKRIQ